MLSSWSLKPTHTHWTRKFISEIFLFINERLLNFRVERRKENSNSISGTAKITVCEDGRKIQRRESERKCVEILHS